MLLDQARVDYFICGDQDKRSGQIRRDHGELFIL